MYIRKLQQVVVAYPVAIVKCEAPQGRELLENGSLEVK